MREGNPENRRKVLLVNGRSDTSLQSALEREGCEVTICESPQKAWGFVYPVRPHLIILRLDEPDHGSVCAVQECRALAAGVPLILAVRRAQREEFATRLGDSGHRFLHLPLEPDALAEVFDGLQCPRGNNHAGSGRRKRAL